MSFNLFISYDLEAPGQSYDRITSAIKGLGKWYKVQWSLFYVHTEHSPDAAHTIVAQAMDGNDKLCVVDAKYAVITPIPDADVAAINRVWFT